MKKKHDENCKEVNQGFSKGEGYTCMCESKSPTHTPTPWTIDNAECNGMKAIVNDSEESTICLFSKEHDIDAAFIVRAVNAYAIYKDFAERVSHMVLVSKELQDEAMRVIARAEGL